MITATLLKYNIKLQYRHGFYFAYAFISATFILILKLLSPTVSQRILPFFIISDPTMLGFFFVGALILLEKDENVLTAIAVTPLSGKGYLIYRVASTFILSFLFTLLMLPIMGLEKANYFLFIPVCVMAASEAPIISVLLASLAGNKVDGMGIGNLLGLLQIVPFLVYLIPGKWQIVFGVIPTYWVVRTFKLSFVGGTDYWLSLIAGFFIHIVVLKLLTDRFEKKAMA